MQPSLRTARLSLEPQVAAHAPLLFDALLDPSLYVHISILPPESVEALAARLEVLQGRRSPDGCERWVRWTLFRREDAAVVGSLDGSLHADGTFEFGYLLFAPFRGHGYATEAVAEVLRYSASLGATRFRATVTVGNTASARVVQRCGLRLARVIPDNDRVRGALVDDWEFVATVVPEAGANTDHGPGFSRP